MMVEPRHMCHLENRLSPSDDGRDSDANFRSFPWARTSRLVPHVRVDKLLRCVTFILILIPVQRSCTQSSIRTPCPQCHKARRIENKSFSQCVIFVVFAGTKRQQNGVSIPAQWKWIITFGDPKNGSVSSHCLRLLLIAFRSLRSCD